MPVSKVVRNRLKQLTLEIGRDYIDAGDDSCPVLENFEPTDIADQIGTIERQAFAWSLAAFTGTGAGKYTPTPPAAGVGMPVVVMKPLALDVWNGTYGVDANGNPSSITSKYESIIALFFDALHPGHDGRFMLWDNSRNVWIDLMSYFNTGSPPNYTELGQWSLGDVGDVFIYTGSPGVSGTGNYIIGDPYILYNSSFERYPFVSSLDANFTLDQTVFGNQIYITQGCARNRNANLARPLVITQHNQVTNTNTGAPYSTGKGWYNDNVSVYALGVSEAIPNLAFIQSLFDCLIVSFPLSPADDGKYYLPMPPGSYSYYITAILDGVNETPPVWSGSLDIGTKKNDTDTLCPALPYVNISAIYANNANQQLPYLPRITGFGVYREFRALKLDPNTIGNAGTVEVPDGSFTNVVDHPPALIGYIDRNSTQSINGKTFDSLVRPFAENPKLLNFYNNVAVYRFVTDETTLQTYHQFELTSEWFNVDKGKQVVLGVGGASAGDIAAKIADLKARGYTDIYTELSGTRSTHGRFGANNEDTHNIVYTDKSTKVISSDLRWNCWSIGNEETSPIYSSICVFIDRDSLGNPVSLAYPTDGVGIKWTTGGATPITPENVGLRPYVRCASNARLQINGVDVADGTTLRVRIAPRWEDRTNAITFNKFAYYSLPDHKFAEIGATGIMPPVGEISTYNIGDVCKVGDQKFGWDILDENGVLKTRQIRPTMSAPSGLGYPTVYFRGIPIDLPGDEINDPIVAMITVKTIVTQTNIRGIVLICGRQKSRLMIVDSGVPVVTETIYDYGLTGKRAWAIHNNVVYGIDDNGKAWKFEADVSVWGQAIGQFTDISETKWLIDLRSRMMPSSAPLREGHAAYERTNSEDDTIVFSFNAYGSATQDPIVIGGAIPNGYGGLVTDDGRVVQYVDPLQCTTKLTQTNQQLMPVSWVSDSGAPSTLAATYFHMMTGNVQYVYYLKTGRWFIRDSYGTNQGFGVKDNYALFYPMEWKNRRIYWSAVGFVINGSVVGTIPQITSRMPVSNANRFVDYLKTGYGGGADKYIALPYWAYLRLSYLDGGELFQYKTYKGMTVAQSYRSSLIETVGWYMKDIQSGAVQNDTFTFLANLPNMLRNVRLRFQELAIGLSVQKTDATAPTEFRDIVHDFDKSEFRRG